MSWRTGSRIFKDFWRVIQDSISERDERIRFTAELLQVFARNDFDPSEVEDICAEVRAAMVVARIPITEPNRYEDLSEPVEIEILEPLPGTVLDRVRAQGPDHCVYSLQPILAASKRRSYQYYARLVAMILVHFLQDNRLTTRTLVLPSEAIPDDLAIRVSDLTHEGLEFYFLAEPKWQEQLARGASPTDTTQLSRTLQSMRHS